MEEWRDIEGYEGYYQVSNFGRVRSLDRYLYKPVGSNKQWGYEHRKSVILNSKPNHDGYIRVSLRKGDKYRKIFVHRLVAQAFIPNPNNYNEINHRNEVKTDNRVENLEWCSREYNMNYGTGRKRASSRLFKPVLQYTKNGEFVQRYSSQTEAEKETGIPRGSISQACVGKTHKSAGGYVWKYA